MIQSNIGDMELLQDKGFVKNLDENHLTYANSVNEFIKNTWKSGPEKVRNSLWDCFSTLYIYSYISRIIRRD